MNPITTTELPICPATTTVESNDSTSAAEYYSDVPPLILGIVTGMVATSVAIWFCTRVLPRLKRRLVYFDGKHRQLTERHPLLKFIRQRKWDQVVSYLKEQEKKNEKLKKSKQLDLFLLRDKRGNTILHYAVLYTPSLEALEAILNYSNASKNLAYSLNVDRELPLHWSLTNRTMRNISVLKLLLQYNPNSIFAKDRNFKSVFQNLESRLWSGNRRQTFPNHPDDANDVASRSFIRRRSFLQTRDNDRVLRRAMQPRAGIPHDGQFSSQLRHEQGQGEAHDRINRRLRPRLSTHRTNENNEENNENVRDYTTVPLRRRNRLSFAASEHSEFEIAWEELALTLYVAFCVKHKLPVIDIHDDFQLLHAALDIRQVPFNICSFLIEKLPSQAFQQENRCMTEDERLPLHVSCSILGRSDVESFHLINALLTINPEAANRKTKSGRLPLAIAVESNKSPDIIKLLYHSGSPDLVNEVDSTTSLLPFMAAACKRSPKQTETISSKKFGRRNSFFTKRNSMDMVTNCFELLKKNPAAISNAYENEVIETNYEEKRARSKR